MNRTPLYNIHVKMNAHMGEFNGWMMPIYYSGILEEHKRVREKAGIFDLCHMGRLRIRGKGAYDLIEKLTTNDISVLKPLDVQYSLVCNHEGGIMDDILVYNLGDGYLLVVNAGNRQVILSWSERLQKDTGIHAEIEDASEEMAMVAIQGPLSHRILQGLVDMDLDTIKYYRFNRGNIRGARCLISRTGYTGEDGFEIFMDVQKAEFLWSELLSAGKDCGLEPIGLGARDTLRLEAGMPLYGHELNVHTNPFEAGLERFVKFDKDDFVGRKPLVDVSRRGVSRKLIGFEMGERAIPRSGYSIVKDGIRIGGVTSGSFSPTLNKNIGFGYVEIEYAKEGLEFEIEIRGRCVKAVAVKTPFYRRRRS